MSLPRKSVRGEEVSVHVGLDGKVQAVTGSFHPAPSTEFVAKISSDDAIARAHAFVGAKALRVPSRAKRIWLPVAGQLQAVFQVFVASRTPLGDFEIIVAADSGKILGGENHLCTLQGEGKGWDHSPIYGPAVSVTGEGDVHKARRRSLSWGAGEGGSPAPWNGFGGQGASRAV